MNLKIKKTVLLEALIKVSKALSNKNLVPILGCIKFNLKTDKLILTATDNDIIIEVTILQEKENMEIIKEGSFIIQGKYIIDIVKKLADEVIEIKVLEDYKILINSKNSEFNLNGLNENEYPKINLDINKNPIKINNKLFKNIINQTSFASSNDESRPVLTGINFNIVGNLLECTATDSYRLAKTNITINTKIENDYNIIIPSKNLLELIKILDDNNDDIEIHIFNNKILFKINNVLFQSRLINGQYPNTTNLIPQESNLKIKINTLNLYDVLDRASILTSDKEKNIIFFETKKQKLFIKSSSLEIGKVEEKIDIEKNNDSEIKIAFSSKYMMDSLKSFNDEYVDILLVSETKPIIIKSTEHDNLI
ncbi:MAG: DNA polymerase III subunit beta, partial [Tenericutes bacterium]|nr:DNA polymerase III subunit beta [Mycoplasmatota bacterium]